MFADVPALHSALIALSPRDFVSHYLLEPVPFVFGHELGQWIHWKTTLGDKIGVDPRSIAMTGSAAIGFSLNPHKSFKPFDKDSDLDVAVVSQHHFDISWHYLRRQRTLWLGLPAKVRNAIEDHRKNKVFSGVIATNNMLGILPFGLEWQAALDAMTKEPPSSGRDITIRVFRDFDALRSYQSYNIQSIRDRLSESHDEEIPVEE